MTATKPRPWLCRVGPCAAAGLLLLTLVPAASRAEDPARKPPDAPKAETKGEAGEKLKFLRFVEDGAEGGKLEAAVATYRNADGVTVDLVSAVHLGDKSYFESLNKSFDGYEVVLYELVKPKDVDLKRRGPRPASPVRGARMIGGLQLWLSDTLDLEFQLDAVDYGRPNFVHADLDAETFAKLQEERGESIFTLMIRSMLSEMERRAAGEGGPDITVIDLIAAMTSPDSARQYKLLLARQFENMEAQMAGIEGPNGSVILGERNKAALRVLRETIRAGKRNIAVYYGAGHMRGIEDALLAEMGFRRTGVRWLTAWDMTTAPAQQQQGAAPAGQAGQKPAEAAARQPAETGAGRRD